MGEQFNKCDCGHYTKDEIRKYPIADGGNAMLCYNCYKMQRETIIAEGHPVYDWATLEVVSGVVPNSLESGQVVLAAMEKRLQGHDFYGEEILDDAWCDHVCARLGEYFEDGEFEILDGVPQDIEDDYSAVSEGLNLVAREFVRYLAGYYGLRVINADQP